MTSFDLLVMCPVSTVGGTERVVFQVARGAAHAGLTVKTLLTHPIEQPELMTWYRTEHIPLATSRFLKPRCARHLLSSMLGLRHEVSLLAPRAVNLHNPGNTILATDLMALKLAGVKRIVCSVHHPLEPATLPRSWKASTRLAASMCDRIVVTSPALKANMEEIGVPERILHTIPLGVEPLQRRLDRSEARKELDIPQDAFVVGALARMEPYKRLDVLIRACSAVPEFGRRGMLLLAGTGPEESRLKALAAEWLPGRHRFLGRIAEPSAFYASLDLFGLLSQLEGFGLVYGEAGLAGVPSVGCDAGGARYAIRNGESGFLVPVNHPEGFSEILAGLMESPQTLERLGLHAKRLAESELSLSEFENRYLSLLFPGRAAPLIREALPPWAASN